VPLFDRRPLHERLLAAAEPDPVEWEPAAEPFAPNLDRAVVHGVARRREWDAVVTVEAPGAKGESIQFVTLEDGNLVVEEGDDTGDLSPFADAVEEVIPRPYRAVAVRQARDVFAVGARRLRIVALPDVEGETVTLTVQDGSRELELDGERIFGGLPALERVGETVARDYVVRGERLDGALFEVRVDAL
jgi:hypothetical protein